MNMVLNDYEKKVLYAIRNEMLKATDINGINKVYRQGRIWNRWHSIGMERDFKLDPSYNSINVTLKMYRYEARRKIENN